MANARSYYAQLQHECMETEKIDNSKFRVWDGKGENGLTSFKLSGAEVNLKAGSLWVRPGKDKKRYDLAYSCRRGDCSLILSEN